MGTKRQTVKSLRTKEFVEDNGIWVFGFRHCFLGVLVLLGLLFFGFFLEMF